MNFTNNSEKVEIIIEKLRQMIRKSLKLQYLFWISMNNFFQQFCEGAIFSFLNYKTNEKKTRHANYGLLIQFFCT